MENFEVMSSLNGIVTLNQVEQKILRWKLRQLGCRQSAKVRMLRPGRKQISCGRMRRRMHGPIPAALRVERYDPYWGAPRWHAPTLYVLYALVQQVDGHMHHDK